MKELILKNGNSVVIRKARISDANEILEYVNKISVNQIF
ncbi:hypothetical protein DSBG_0203 [Desulfosporosinus sp. BG]|nr:hypothetical protein DSBG_0203 [Desulfosporosinus sp. BG]